MCKCFTVLLCCFLMMGCVNNTKKNRVKDKPSKNLIENTFEIIGRNQLKILIQDNTVKKSNSEKNWSVKINDTLISTLKQVSTDSLISHLIVQIKKFKIHEPVNPILQYKNRQFTFKPSYNGNQLIWKKFEHVVRKSIKNKVYKTNLIDLKCYENAKYSEQDPLCTELIAKAKTMAKTKVVFEYNGQRFELKPEELSRYITTNETMNLHVDENKAYHFGAEIARALDVIHSPISFIDATDKQLTISRSELGKRVNIQQITKLLAKAVESKNDLTTDVPFIMHGVPVAALTTNRNYIEVNLTNQKIYFFKNNQVVLTSDIVTGNVNIGLGTPAGAFFIRYKDHNISLDGPGYSAYVNYFMPIYNGIGLHDAGWRGRFGGEIYKSDGSHGCINLPKSVAEFAYNNYPAGTVVICH